MATTTRDRKFMEMAVKEMRDSRSEHSDKHDPLVGAMLVGANGQVLGTAHRGKLRRGEHAEFTLIERLLGDEELDGSTLYVTLEPCTVRQPPKISCAKRVVSARIKRVFIGMLDPNPDIQGHGVIHLQKHGVEVDFFDLDLVQEIRAENKNFVEQYERVESRSAETDEREAPSDMEKEVVPAASTQDLSPEVIADYLASRQLTCAIPSRELWEFFTKAVSSAAMRNEGVTRLQSRACCSSATDPRIFSFRARSRWRFTKEPRSRQWTLADHCSPCPTESKCSSRKMLRPTP
jgi:pyrimidine deaminase RibD-like protein